LLDRDHTIGHAYFMGVNSKNDLCCVFKNQIIPLLQEYFYTDWNKIRMVLGDNEEWKKNNDERFVQVKKQYKTVDEKALFGFDLDEYDEQRIYSLNPVLENCEFEKFPKEGIVHIYEKPGN